MEFRFRAVDGKQPAQSSSQSGSSEAAMQAIFSVPTVRPTLVPTENQNQMLVQEAILREIEKEQIRREIIAAEASRRRELIAEVRREMAMESVTWIGQRVPLPPTIDTRWLDQRVALTDSVLRTGPFSLASSSMVQPPLFVPFPEASVAQVTPPVDPGKNELIVLDRPDDSSYSEAKRKAEEPPAVDVPEPHLSVFKKKAKAEWSCALCQVTATCERGLNDHFQGKKHKAKQASLSAENTNMKKVSPKLTKLKNLDEAEKASPPMAEKEQSREQEGSSSGKRGFYKFWCDICNVGMSGEVVMENHKLGKKHKARLSEQEQRDAINTAKTTRTDLSTEVKVEDPMTEEAKGEDPAAEEATVVETNEKNPMAAEAKVEVNEENPMAEEAKEEDQTVEAGNVLNMGETYGEDSTVEEVKVEDQASEEATGENPLGEEAHRENPMDEKAMGEYTTVEDLNGNKSEGEDPTVVEVNEEHPVTEKAKVEVNEENSTDEEAKEEDQTVEEFTGNRLNMEETYAEDLTVEERKEEAPTAVENTKEL